MLFTAVLLCVLCEVLQIWNISYIYSLRMLGWKYILTPEGQRHAKRLDSKVPGGLMSVLSLIYVVFVVCLLFGDPWSKATGLAIIILSSIRGFINFRNRRFYYLWSMFDSAFCIALLISLLN